MVWCPTGAKKFKGCSLYKKAKFPYCFGLHFPGLAEIWLTLPHNDLESAIHACLQHYKHSARQNETNNFSERNNCGRLLYMPTLNTNFIHANFRTTVTYRGSQEGLQVTNSGWTRDNKGWSQRFDKRTCLYQGLIKTSPPVKMLASEIWQSDHCWSHI